MNSLAQTLDYMTDSILVTRDICIFSNYGLLSRLLNLSLALNYSRETILRQQLRTNNPW
jgi:hypothetical protein